VANLLDGQRSLFGIVTTCGFDFGVPSAQPLHCDKML